MLGAISQLDLVPEQDVRAQQTWQPPSECYGSFYRLAVCAERVKPHDIDATNTIIGVVHLTAENATK